jgi:hypothetical protein
VLLQRLGQLGARVVLPEALRLLAELLRERVYSVALELPPPTEVHSESQPASLLERAQPESQSALLLEPAQPEAQVSPGIL